MGRLFACQPADHFVGCHLQGQRPRLGVARPQDRGGGKQFAHAAGMESQPDAGNVLPLARRSDFDQTRLVGNHHGPEHAGAVTTKDDLRRAQFDGEVLPHGVAELFQPPDVLLVAGPEVALRLLAMVERRRIAFAQVDCPLGSNAAQVHRAHEQERKPKAVKIHGGSPRPDVT